jgi:hypothetical protein
MGEALNHSRFAMSDEIAGRRASSVNGQISVSVTWLALITDFNSVSNMRHPNISSPSNGINNVA